MVKASIIIVSYNNLYTTTVPCLESILKKKSDTDFEIIVVDNNSNDGTQDYLNSIAARDQRVKPLLNNKGFAAANNEAIKASKGEYLILLNSDTVVTETWLEGLLSPLNDNSSIGIVGPVSNMSGNEQRIYTKGETVNDIISEGSLWTSMSKGDMFETKRLDFFCVAMKKI
jgi:GT2 family glycosyltransferase